MKSQAMLANTNLSHYITGLARGEDQPDAGPIRCSRFIKSCAIALLIACSCLSLRVMADTPNTEDPEQPSSQLTRYGQTMVINIHGKISRLLLDKIRKTTQRLPVENRFPPSLVVTLDSLGGDGEAAIEIGRLLRNYNAHIFVTNRCGSACVFIYAGGAFRAAIPNSIGIHQPRVTISDNNARILKELDVNKNEVAQTMLNNFDNKANEYFIAMGIGNGFYERVQSQKTKELYWLDEKEIEKYQLSGYTAETLNAVTNDLNLKNNNNPDKNKTILNSQNVLKECVYYKNEPSNFLKCYVKVMGSNYKLTSE